MEREKVQAMVERLRKMSLQVPDRLIDLLQTLDDDMDEIEIILVLEMLGMKSGDGPDETGLRIGSPRKPIPNRNSGAIAIATSGEPIKAVDTRADPHPH